MSKLTRENLSHLFPAFIEEGSEILILGSFPSRLSREEGFYYANPQNRFWKVLSGVYHELEPMGISAKKALLSRHRLALSDVVESCSIIGSDDSSIENIAPFHLKGEGKNLRLVILNGQTAGRLFERYLEEEIALPYVILPSTSPRNAKESLASLIDVYRRNL